MKPPAKLGAGVRAITVNGMGATGMTAAETLVRLVYFVAITRLVGPEGYGLYSWALAFYGVILSGALLGFETLVPYAYGKGNAEGDRQAGVALSLRIGVTMLVGLGLTIYAQLAEREAAEMLALLAVAPAMLLRGTAMLNRSVHVGRQEVVRNVPHVLAGRFVELSGGIALILLGAPIAALLVLHWVAWGLEALLSWLSLRKRSEVRPGVPSGADGKPMLRKGVPLGLYDLSSSFLILAPVVLYKPLASDLAELGQVSVSVQLQALLLAAGFAFLGSAAPVLARTREGGDTRIGRYPWLVALIAMVVTAVLALAWQVVSVPVFALVFGHDYDLARELTTWTILVAGMIFLPHGFQQILIMEDKLLAPLVANLAGCAVAVAGFASLPGLIGPFEAMQIVLTGWLLRAIILFTAGSLATRRMLGGMRSS